MGCGGETQDSFGDKFEGSFISHGHEGDRSLLSARRRVTFIYRRLPEEDTHHGEAHKPIICGAWSDDNMLALGSEDKTLTISAEDGDTKEQTELRYAPQDIQFKEGAGSGSSTISINMGGRTVFLYDMSNPDNPVELQFQSMYGTIMTYRWFGDGHMMLGFSNGVSSTEMIVAIIFPPSMLTFFSLSFFLSLLLTLT